VRPGVLLTRASAFLPSRRFNRLDLPTFDRPTKSTCGRPSRRKSARPKAERMNSALSTLALNMATGTRALASPGRDLASI